MIRMKPLATANYDFERLITDGCVYIDKTDMLYRLASSKDSIYFISRPRRFGKSLMLSTLKCLFEGKKKLFKGLKIEKKWDWSKTYPVIDLNMSDFDKEGTREGFRHSLGTELQERLERAAISYRDSDTPAMLFDRLVKGLAAASPEGKVVVLVDEYDHPLGGLLDAPKALRSMRREMHGFYSTLKNNVGVIRFLMMTGVSKFTKLSVFSGLNNLTDLTIGVPAYAALLGYTVKEIETVLAPHLKSFARKQRVPQEKAIRLLRAWYDSYRFCPYSGARVLNPVAVGRALTTGILMNYWSKTGMPTLILERLQVCGKRPDNIDGVTATFEDLDVCDAEELPWVSLLYQSGYLTIKDVVWTDDADGRRVTELVLGVPNLEVRASLKSLWWKQLMKIEEKDFTALVDVAKGQLADGDVRMLVGKTLFSLYAALSPTWRVKDEADAKRYFLLFMRMLGANVQAEEVSAFGNADAIVETKKGVYVFEFKFNRTARAAVRQIREKGYADAYKADARPVTLVGINFSAKKRNIDEPLIEPLSLPISSRLGG
ncbi:MAG: AAA family ATPase [Kiritimatiellae bacterium]|nr:AAA family ATPase [Kiritimatiellia bacterium]